MAKITQNEELGIVVGVSMLSGAVTYVTQLPIPLEFKAPTLTFLGVAYTTVITWWRLKVNMPEEQPQTYIAPAQ